LPDRIESISFPILLARSVIQTTWIHSGRCGVANGEGGKIRSLGIR
jgi:hypothetical protein